MAVKVVNKQGGQTFTGKFVDIKEGTVSLWSGMVADKKGDFRGCGRKVGAFPEATVTIQADDPTREIRRR